MAALLELHQSRMCGARHMLAASDACDTTHGATGNCRRNGSSPYTVYFNFLHLITARHAFPPPTGPATLQEFVNSFPTIVGSRPKGANFCARCWRLCTGRPPNYFRPNVARGNDSGSPPFFRRCGGRYRSCNNTDKVPNKGEPSSVLVATDQPDPATPREKCLRRFHTGPRSTLPRLYPNLYLASTYALPRLYLDFT